MPTRGLPWRSGWTILVVEANNDDYAGVLFVVTVPLGFVVGTFVAMIVARSAEGSSPFGDDLFIRTQLAFMAGSTDGQRLRHCTNARSPSCSSGLRSGVLAEGVDPPVVAVAPQRTDVPHDR